MLAVQERAARVASEPPGPPTCDDGEDNGDRCLRCPVRQAMLEKEASGRAQQDELKWLLVVFEMMNYLWHTSPVDVDRAQNVRLMTYLPCNGPEVAPPRPLSLARGWARAFGSRVLRCTNQNVPWEVRNQHVEHVGYEGDD